MTKQLDSRTLGRTAVTVTALSFGGAPIGNFRRAFDEDSAEHMVDEAWRAGMRYFDTAPGYGQGLSEHRLGHALRKHSRDEYVLSSKVGRVLTPCAPGMFDSGPWVSPPPFKATFDYSYDGVMRSVEDSLQRLLTDRIEIVLMHDCDRYTHGDAQPQAIEQALSSGFKALLELRAQGVVDAIGVGVNEVDVCLDVLDQVDIDCLLLAGRYTLLEQSPLDVLFPECASRGVGVILGGVFNSGVLAKGARPGASFNYAPAPDEVLTRAAHLEAVCARHGVSLAAAALQFAAAHPVVSSVCVGSRDEHQQADSVRLFEQELPGGLWSDLCAEGLIRDDAPTPRTL